MRSPSILAPMLLVLAATPDAAAQPASPHHEALRLNADRPPFDFPPIGIVAQQTPPRPRTVRTVYGYYPYWISAWEQVRWDLLTHIAFFAIEMNADGTLGNAHGWPDADFVETAHTFGVRADVTFTLFSGSGIMTLCSSDTNRARGIANMIDAMEAGGADGINVDFEGLSDGTRDCFTQYIRELREGLEARGHTSAGIGIAAPAVDWTNEFDLGELARYTDVFFIMGYGYHWTRSGKAGPVGQLRVTASWRPHVSISMQRTIAHYTGLVTPERRNVIVFGVPYYGRDWPTASGDMHAATTGEGASRTYAVARRAVEGGRVRQFDADSQNPFYTYQEGGVWHQTWYDDEESLAAKYQLALEQNIGGVGMWALGFDDDYPELWDTLDAYFTEEPVPLEGTRENPRLVELPYEASDDLRGAPSNYFNAYACAPDLPQYGREIVYATDVCQPGTLVIEIEDGEGVDVDLHLLDGLDETRCVARNDRRLETAVAPGRHWFVADAYVSNQVPQEGPFTLRAELVPEPGTTGCGPDERCDRGRCISSAIEVRVPDAAELGRMRVGAPNAPAYAVAAEPEAEKVAPGIDEASCACRSAGAGGSSAFIWLLLVVFARRRVLGA